MQKYYCCSPLFFMYIIYNVLWKISLVFFYILYNSDDEVVYVVFMPGKCKKIPVGNIGAWAGGCNHGNKARACELLQT